MGNLKPCHNHLKNLQAQEKQLTETGLALDALFTEEESRLSREDEASHLRSVYQATVEQLQRLEEMEAVTKHGHSRVNLILSLGELFLTAMISKGRRMLAIADCLLKNSSDKQQPFGLVLISVGPRGLPEDLQVVSISQLARESNRAEPEIISKLREDGYLLFSEKEFSLLIDRLIDDIREGRQHLPVSREKLSEIAALNKPKPGIRTIEIISCQLQGEVIPPRSCS